MHFSPTQESVSEDPHLNGMYSASLVQGFQGDDPVHLGVAATCKHFLAYSLEGGPAAEGFTVKWLNAAHLVIHLHLAEVAEWLACARRTTNLCSATTSTPSSPTRICKSHTCQHSSSA